MAEILGRDIQMGVATEATRGTADTIADKWFRKVTATIVERANHAVDDTTVSNLADGMGRRVVQKYVEGELNGIIHGDALGWLTANLYGICVSTLVTGAVYSHVFNLKNVNQHISLTIFAKDGSIQQQTFANCMINTLTMSVAIDDYLRFSASFIGGIAAVNSDTPTYGTEYDFIARDVVIKIAASAAGLSGATAIKAKAMDVTWDQGLIRDHVVGALTPNDTYNSQMNIEGKMTLNFSTTTYKDLFLADTAQYMSITITGQADIGAGNFPTITLLMNKVQFMDWSRSGDIGELVTEEVSFRAFYNQTDAKQSQLTIKNNTTAYANVPTS